MSSIPFKLVQSPPQQSEVARILVAFGLNGWGAVLYACGAGIEMDLEISGSDKAEDYGLDTPGKKGGYASSILVWEGVPHWASYPGEPGGEYTYDEKRWRELNKHEWSALRDGVDPFESHRIVVGSYWTDEYTLPLDEEKRGVVEVLEQDADSVSIAGFDGEDSWTWRQKLTRKDFRRWFSPRR